MYIVYEPAARGAPEHTPVGVITQSTVWRVANLNPFGSPGARTGHGTEPVEVMRRPLNHTEAGESVYDPFLGSGTALITAQITGASVTA
jgi:DNA modification methylase